MNTTRTIRSRVSSQVKSYLRILPLWVSIILFFQNTYSQPPETMYDGSVKNYPLPSGNYRVVSPTGSGTEYSLANPGKLNGNALNTAPAGTTIVLRGGTYRIGNIYYNKNLTIQPYLSEVPVLKGSQIATNWVKAGNNWQIVWNSVLPSPAPDYEKNNTAIWNNEIVVVGGVPLRQVEQLSQVNSSTFHIDYNTNTITFGANPTDKTLELTKFAVGLVRNEGDANNTDAGTIKGLTFMHYGGTSIRIGNDAPTSNVTTNTFGSKIPNVIIKNNRFLQNGKTGVSVSGNNALLENNEMAFNGFQGAFIQSANNALIKNNWVHNNNYKKLKEFPAALKIFNQCENVVVKDNLIESNDAVGIWFDVGIKNSSIVNNLCRNNAHVGIKIEISEDCIIAGNLIVNATPGWSGISILNAAGIKIYNNTVAGTSSPIKIRRTDRSAANDPFGWHASAGPDLGNYENHMIANNLIALSKGGVLLDISESSAACGLDVDPQVSILNHNGYYRTSNTNPTNLLNWAPYTNNNCNKSFISLPGFRNSVAGYEMNGIDFIGSQNPFFVNVSNSNIANGNYKLKNNSVALQAGTTLPNDVRNALGWSNASIVDMGAYQSENSIKFSNTPTDIESGVSFSVDVDYVAKLNSDVVIIIKDPSNNIVREVRKSVNSGSGTTSITVNQPTDFPIANGYLLKVALRATGGGWTADEPSDSKNIDVIAPNRIVSVNYPSTVETGSDFNVTVNYTVGEASDIVVIVKNNSNDLFIEQKATVTSGSGTITFPLVQSTPIPVADDYILKVAIRDVDGGWTTEKVDEIRSIDITPPNYNAIEFESYPVLVESGQSFNVDVSYVSQTNSEVVAVLFNPSFNFLMEERLSVASGIGNATITINPNTDWEIGKDYIIKVMLRDVGGDYTTNKVLKSNNFDVTSAWSSIQNMGSLTYISASNPNSMNCTASNVSNTEKFKIIPLSNNKVAIQGYNSKYVSSQNGSQAMTCADSTIGAYNIFTMVDYGNGEFALLANNNLYLRYNMWCTSSTVGTWQKFKIVPVSGSSSKSVLKKVVNESSFEKIALYPNPAISDLIIKGISNGQYKISIYNIQGKHILTTSNTSYNSKAIIDVSNLRTGIYLVKITTKSIMNTLKFIKQ